MSRLAPIAVGVIVTLVSARAVAQDAASDAAAPTIPDPSPARHADAPTTHAIRYVLENGLHVVLDPTDEDTVGVCVTYHVGASVQPSGWTGLAHLTEHVMFGGTRHVPGHFLDQLDALGVLDVNGLTGRDETRYYEVVPHEHLERTLFLEADRMAFGASSLEAHTVALQQQVVLREREERVDLGGLGLIPGLEASVLYAAAGHPYADLFEHREDIEAIAPRDVQWFLATYYAPDTATLAVSGGFDPDRARAWIARWFGPIGRIAAAPAPVSQPAITRVPVERRLVVEAPLLHDQLRVIWPTPPYGTSEDSALDLVALWLERRLRAELLDTSRATAVEVSQGSFEVASELAISVTVPRGDGTQFALDAIDRALAALDASPLSQRELDDLSRSVVSGDLIALESITHRVSRLATHISRAPDQHWSLDWDRDRYTAVTPRQLHDVAHEWLPPHQRLVLSLAARRDAPWDGRIVVDLSLGPDGQPVTPP